MRKPSLGQHWLYDVNYLAEVVDTAELEAGDHVLEIGPGLGSLTEQLLAASAEVTAVELDEKLYAQLLAERRQMFKPYAQRLEIVKGDILKFDLTRLPAGYKVVANIPYYLTGKLLRMLTDSANPPQQITLIIQKEVAQRLAAKPGQLSIIAVVVQLFGKVQLGEVVPASAFTPPPKVDSQIINIARHKKALFPHLNKDNFFRVVKAGFSEKRKKLRSSLAGGLGMKTEAIEEMLGKAGIDPARRAQELSLKEWHDLAQIWQNRVA